MSSQLPPRQSGGPFNSFRVYQLPTPKAKSETKVVESKNDLTHVLTDLKQGLELLPDTTVFGAQIYALFIDLLTAINADRPNAEIQNIIAEIAIKISEQPTTTTTSYPNQDAEVERLKLELVRISELHGSEIKTLTEQVNSALHALNQGLNLNPILDARVQGFAKVLAFLQRLAAEDQLVTQLNTTAKTVQSVQAQLEKSLLARPVTTLHVQAGNLNLQRVEAEIGRRENFGQELQEGIDELGEALAYLGEQERIVKEARKFGNGEGKVDTKQQRKLSVELEKLLQLKEANIQALQQLRFYHEVVSNGLSETIFTETLKLPDGGPIYLEVVEPIMLVEEPKITTSPPKSDLHLEDTSESEHFTERGLKLAKFSESLGFKPNDLLLLTLYEILPADSTMRSEGKIRSLGKVAKAAATAGVLKIFGWRSQQDFLQGSCQNHDQFNTYIKYGGSPNIALHSRTEVPLPWEPEDVITRKEIMAFQEAILQP